MVSTERSQGSGGRPPSGGFTLTREVSTDTHFRNCGRITVSLLSIRVLLLFVSLIILVVVMEQAETRTLNAAECASYCGCLRSTELSCSAPTPVECTSRVYELSRVLVGVVGAMLTFVFCEVVPWPALSFFIGFVNCVVHIGFLLTILGGIEGWSSVQVCQRNQGLYAPPLGVLESLVILSAITAVCSVIALWHNVRLFYDYRRENLESARVAPEASVMISPGGGRRSSFSANEASSQPLPSGGQPVGA